ncbi:hypothetical protein [Phenylobacterium sp.]|uniref:hypothetical protein n=1 Tax=Phenylobacterium sp. TaxID=1871053 RepID=UPI00301E6136
MLLKVVLLEAIRRGEVSLVYRRWTRPSVKTGGTLNTAVGQLAIDEVAAVDPAGITDAEAQAAGAASADRLRVDLAGEGTVYRVRVRYLGADPRQALREDTDLTGVLERLGRLDIRGAWTAGVLDLIARHPGRRAGDLAAMLGLETPSFKLNVRKLKALGLTESLEVGYRLSPRGQAARKAMMSR